MLEIDYMVSHERPDVLAHEDTHRGDRGAAGHDWVRVTSPNRSQGSTAKILVPGGPFWESCSSFVTSGRLVGDTGQVSSVTLGHLANDME